MVSTLKVQRYLLQNILFAPKMQMNPCLYTNTCSQHCQGGKHIFKTLHYNCVIFTLGQQRVNTMEESSAQFTVLWAHNLH